jgi:hypothetical protein
MRRLTDEEAISEISRSPIQVLSGGRSPWLSKQAAVDRHQRFLSLQPLPCLQGGNAEPYGAKIQRMGLRRPPPEPKPEEAPTFRYCVNQEQAELLDEMISRFRRAKRQREGQANDPNGTGNRSSGTGGAPPRKPSPTRSAMESSAARNPSRARAGE